MAETAQRISPEMLHTFEGAQKELYESKVVENAIREGDAAPDFTLPDALGNEFTLSAQLNKGPVVLTWYRGSWCPYCNIQLHDYQKSLHEIHAAGAQLVAVSPELPDSALTWKEKEQLDFVVLSDVGNEVAREYGIVYRTSDRLSDFYEKGGRVDLYEHNGDESMELPLAVTYIIDVDGSVAYAFVDADYRKRAETGEIVEFVANMGADDGE